MKQRFAIVTMKVPLNPEYPWKVGQTPDIAGDIQNHLCDALQYKDYLHGVCSIKVVVLEKGATDEGAGGDKLGDSVRDSRAHEGGSGGGGEG